MKEATPKQNRIGELIQSVGEDYLATITPPPDAANYKGEATDTPADGLPIPQCATEKPAPLNLEGHGSPLALQVGFYGDIPRWKPGSVIQYATYAGGYPTLEDAKYAANQLIKAANEWNGKNIGVTFRWVANLEDACFVLGYGGEIKGGTLAEAFFPNGNDLNNVIVYKGMFSTEWKSHMWEVFTHELGHVLGLRHEFAMDKDLYGRVEGGSVQFGPRDQYSVMNYRPEPPKITQLDTDGTKSFYRYTGTSISSMAIKDWIPEN